MTRLTLIAATLLIAAACSYGAPDAAADTDTEPNPPSDTDTDTGTPPMLQGDWLALVGDLDLVDGVPTAVRVELEVWESFGGELVQVECAPSIAVGPATTAPEDDVSLYGFWTFPIDPDSCDLPDEIGLGFGPLDPTLWPAAEESGASLKHTRGLYTGRSGEVGLTVFGLAGTVDQFNGVGTPASLQPLPDGKYFLRTAYLLPVSESDTP